MQRIVGLALGLVGSLLVGILGPSPAIAGDEKKTLYTSNNAVNLAAYQKKLAEEKAAELARKRGAQKGSGGQGRSNSGSGPRRVMDDPNTVPKAEYEAKRKAWLADVARVNAANRKALKDLSGCPEARRSALCAPVTLVDDPAAFILRPEADGDPAAAAEPVANPALALPPEEIAYAAVVRLPLDPPTPGVGPPPSINEWKMAAVGYPLWLWAEGDLDPATVSSTVYDLTVSLDARLEKVVFTMGDGETVTCTNLNRRWTRAVKPGTESPACGYRYREPSLPKGDYTITAYTTWAVDWAVNGDSGMLPFYQTASTTLPVGELQVLVR